MVPATKDEKKKERFRAKITEYMERAEQLKEHIKQEKESK